MQKQYRYWNEIISTWKDFYKGEEDFDICKMRPGEFLLSVFRIANTIFLTSETNCRRIRLPFRGRHSRCPIWEIHIFLLGFLCVWSILIEVIIKILKDVKKNQILLIKRVRTCFGWFLSLTICGFTFHLT